VQAPIRTPDSKIAYEDFIAGLERINQQEYLIKAHTAGNEHWEEANWEQTVDIMRIIGQIMCIIVLKQTPLLHCVHQTRLFNAQTVFEYNNHPDLGEQVAARSRYFCWQALTRLVPATKNK
jgi:hypothetical protein